MELTQVQNLKLNVTNIKSSLIDSNNKLRKIRVDKIRLLDRYEKKREVEKKEKKIETKNLGIGSGFKKISSAVTSPFRSIFDRMMDFFGLIVLGMVVSNLPRIINAIETFFTSDFIKGVGSVISGIIGAGKVLIEITKLISPGEIEVIKKEKNNAERQIDEVGKLIDQSEKDLNQNQQQKKDPQGEPLNLPPILPIFPGSMYPLSMPNIPAPQKKSAGGTIKGTQTQANRPITRGRTGEQKTQQGSAGLAFAGFKKTAEALKEVSIMDSNNVLLFSGMTDNFRKYTEIDKKFKTPPGSKNGKGGKKSWLDNLKSFGKGLLGAFSSGSWIGNPGDNDGEQTGLNMNLSGGIGAPIYAPFDLIYRSTDPKGRPSVGLQGSPNALGPSGRGFGYYGAYRFKRGDKEYELMMGHFHELPYKGSKDGEIIPKGTLLGYQGASGRSDDGSGGVYPHISLHVNGVGFNASNSILVDTANSIRTGKPIQTTTKVKPAGMSKIGPISKGYGKGGIRPLNRRNRSIIIYAVQPVQTMLPIPMPFPVESGSSDIVIQDQNISSIWRQ